MLGAPATLNVRAMARTDTTEQGPLLRGAKAPGFKLRSTPDQFIELVDFRGRPVLLVFYPADWSPVCSDQLVVYQEIMPEFAKYDAQVLGISVDGAWCHAAFAKNRNLHFPLLSDFEPKGEVARAYGAYRDGEGVAERALFVIDEQGVIAWSFRSSLAVNPGADGFLDALDRMSLQEPSHGHAQGASDAA